MERIVFEGIPVSSGIGVGKLIFIKDINYEVNHGIIDESQVESQITDLEVAICKTFIEIHDLKDGFKGILSEEENRIFEFYKEILDDSYFFEEIKNAIRQEKFHADKAIYTCIQRYIDCIEESDNEYVKHRIFDLNDVRKRLIKNIYSDNEVNFDEIDSSHIVVVRELNPIIAGVLSKKEVKGVVAQDGAGYFSHASIILKSVGIPTLSNTDFKVLTEFRDKHAVLDCNKGILIVNPESSEIFNYNEKLKGIDYVKGAEKFEPTITSDGHRIYLYASISSLKEFNIAKGVNFDGIGLIRTESLIINYDKVPDEKKQFSIYSKMAKTMRNRMVVLRTADIGEDKVPGTLNFNPTSSENISRGIKRSLEHKNEFAIQIRSIMRATAYGNVCITFPMVNSAEEIREVKEIISGIEADPSIKNNEAIKKIKIGAFIETIHAVNEIDNIIEEVDFINIGTNDLLHQFCGLNRKCSMIEKENYLDPEFIKIIKYCVGRAKEHKKPIVICGEMASDPMTVVLLLGLGVEALSITPGAFSEIYNLIRRVNYDEAREITEIAVKSVDINEVKKILSDWINSRM
ncbi:phosphoenolpyruvate--protein phosphotransferase [Acetivibrio cellulolyticus]